MKYINSFHANLNYAYLTPDRYEFVIRTDERPFTANVIS